MELIKILNIMSETNKIKLCKSCNGSGLIPDDSWGSGASDSTKCDVCEGTGRSKIIIVKCEVEVPFNFSEK